MFFRIKVSFSYLWQLLTYSFGVSSNFSQQKSPTAKSIGLNFLGTIVLRKYMPTISAVGLFCCNQFEENPNEKVSKVTETYFSHFYFNNCYVVLRFLRNPLPQLVATWFVYDPFELYPCSPITNERWFYKF